MKKMKKFLSLVMSLVMVVSLFAGIDITSVAFDEIGNYIGIKIPDGYSDAIDVGDEITCDIIASNDWTGFESFEIDIYMYYLDYYEIVGVSAVDESYFSSFKIEQEENGLWKLSGDIEKEPAADTVLFTVTVKGLKSTQYIENDSTITSYYYVYADALFNNNIDDDAYVGIAVLCPHDGINDFEEIPPTCEEDGHEAGQRCMDCGKWLSGKDLYALGHDDYDEDGICDNCSETLSYIKLTSDKIEINPGEEFTVTVSVDNAQGLKEGSVSFAESRADETEYEIVSYEFNENLTFEETDTNYYDFSFDEAVQSDSVDIVTVTYKPLVIHNFLMWFDVYTSDLVMYDDEEYIRVNTLCPHENTTEHPEEAPTCTENGYTAGVYCDDCGEWISGHDWISYGHDDYDEDGICDNCSETLSHIKLTSDKIEINPGEEFTITVSVDNAQGLKEGSVSFAESWADETEYEIVSYEFNENLTFEETDSYNYDFSFDEAVQSDSVDIVTVTYKPLVIDKLYLYFNVYTSDLVMYENNEYILIHALCPHENTTEHPEEAPTCTEGGYTAGVYCNDCDEWVSGHDWVHSWGHVDYDDDNICDNCMNSFSYIKLTSDKTEINPGEEFTITVSVDNAKGLKDGSVNFAYSWADETKYEIVSYEFNENLTFEETDSYYYDFSFDEAVQSDSVDIVTVTYKPLVIDKLLSLGFDVYTSDLVMYGNYEYIWIEMLCPHENTTEHPEEAPTCTEVGYTAGVQCDDCGEWISGHEWINSLGGHVDENEDNICDVCDEHYRLSVGENIIPNTDSNYSFYFKPEKNGCYKIKVDDGISVSGFELDENNEAAFCLKYGGYLYLNTENYVGDDFSVTITLLEEVKTGHADADFDEFCDNCSEEIYSIMDLYCVVAEDETCEITGYELSFFEKNGLPITGDWYDTVYTEIYKYYYDYDVQKSFLVTSIAEGAFVGLNSMKTITIPASVTSIGDYAIGYKEKNDDAKIEGFIIYGYPGTVAEEYAKENGFEFVAIVEYEIENGEAIITAVAEGFGSDYIPAEIAGYPVTTIGENCFADCGLRYLHLPENITTIKAGAFKNNPELGNYSFVIYGTLKTIEDGAFEGCGQIRIDYYGTPEQWNAISIGENNDAFRNAEVTFYGTGHKDFGYVIENGSVRIDYVNYDADFENLVVPETLDGYPVTDLNIGSQEDSDYFGTDYYYQITIPSSVTYISPFSVGYYEDWETGELLLVPDFKIIGVPGSYAETYAKENGITFEALPEVPEEPTTEEPTTEEPTTEEPTTEEPTTEAPTTEPTTKEPVEETTTTITEPENLLGDVNFDGKITAADARIALRIAARLENDATNEQHHAADAINDGMITAADARRILRVSANLDDINGSNDVYYEKAKTPFLSMTAGTATVGETLEVFVYASDFIGTKSADMLFTYDSSKLEFVDIEKNEDFDLHEGGLTEGNEISLSFILLEYAEADEKICTIKFNVLDAGNITLNANVSSWDGTEYPFNCQLVITAIEEEPTTEEPTTEEPTTEEPTTEEPTTEEPTTEEPTTEEPTTEAPTTEPTTKEPVTDVPTTERPSEKPSERPSTDGPATDGPDEKPVSDKLEVSGDTVKVDNTSKISTVKIKSSAEDILKSIKNEKVSVVDKNGKAVTGKTLVGTGSKIQIKDNSGKVINTYTVCVPNDVDGNGKTTAADARLALRGSARLEKIEGVYAQASDVTGDGKITAADARKLLRISAGLE